MAGIKVRDLRDDLSFGARVEGTGDVAPNRPPQIAADDRRRD